jgi:hypothetical protein
MCASNAVGTALSHLTTEPSPPSSDWLLWLRSPMSISPVAGIEADAFFDRGTSVVELALVEI